ncbi:zinc-dependent metalloprotease family protein, partial [Cyanobium gracile UHCC 0139]
MATNSHQALNDPWPGDATDTPTASMGPTCGCRACSVLAVTTGDGAAAWDTSNDQAPLVIDGVVTLGTGVDLSKVFQLHSNPTATKTIYLDFDGYQINNTPWENGGNLSLKSFYSTFDSKALSEIQRIWQRVAEDFAPFNINVTTQDPGTEALRKSGTGDDRWGIRVAFTSNLNLLTGSAIKNAGGGGTAYYNSFNWGTDDVALVFNRGEYTAAETASHEVGHTLGLTHDGAGTSTEYYGGHGGTGPTSWGTIMGAAWLGNDEYLTQWSKGQYTGANNTQDDLATITNGNGFTYRTDDHGNTFSSATALTGLTFSSFGVIERNTDVDMFRFDTAAGQVSFNILNASRAFVGSAGAYSTEYLTSRGANLDIAATLYRADGSVVQTFNPADLTTASFSTSLAAGTYYLGIDGVGFGTPLASSPTGYTDYGSLGQYMVTGTVQPAGSTPPPPTTTTTPPTSSTLQVVDPNGAVELLRDTTNNRVSVRVDGVTAA